MSLLKFLLDLIAPKKCYSCKREGYFLCEDCLKKERNFPSICYVCKGNSLNFKVCEECKNKVFYDKIVILTNYTKFISKLIKDAKFYNRKEIFEDFANYLYNKFLLNEKIKFKDDYVIVSVPSYFWRKLKRGYNSSEVLCKYFAKISGIRCEKNIIIKAKNVPQQSKLSRAERLTNLNGVFKINKRKINQIQDKNVIIIDDVVSTGTTINEVARVLKENGAKNVVGVAIASGS